MHFQFNLPKTLQVLAYILKAGPVDKVKLTKLVYLADRAHFIAHGVPITGDRLCAMDFGPVPSSTLDAINGYLPGAHIFRYLHLNDNKVEWRPGAPASQAGPLSAEECQTLDETIAAHGQKDTWKLVRETHRLPEYMESFVEGTSKTIPYERIAKFSGNAERFRSNRAVISQRAARQMARPFGPDEDL